MEKGKPAKRPESGRAKQGSGRSGRQEGRAISAGKPPTAGPSAGQAEKGAIHPQPVKRVWIPKLGSRELRPLGIPAEEDRVVQTAVRNVIEPIFENILAEHSYGFRPRRGAKDALRRVDHLLDTGRVWVVDADLKGYFDSIPQDKLMEAVAEHIADRPLLELIQRFLKQGVMESGKGWQPTEKGTPPRGGHQPAVSQHLPEPTGPSDGTGRAGNGTLRGRLSPLVPEREGSPGGAGTIAPMGGRSGADPAPGQNGVGQCQRK